MEQTIDTTSALDIKLELDAEAVLIRGVTTITDALVVTVKERDAFKVDINGKVYMQGHSLAFWLVMTATASVAATTALWAVVIWSQLP